MLLKRPVESRVGMPVINAVCVRGRLAELIDLSLEPIKIAGQRRLGPQDRSRSSISIDEVSGTLQYPIAVSWRPFFGQRHIGLHRRDLDGFANGRRPRHV